MAEELLNSGKAWKKFNQIITAQGKKRMPKLAKFSVKITAKQNGKVAAIENKTIAHLARIAGAPKDVSGGLVIHKKIGDKIKRLCAVYGLCKQSGQAKVCYGVCDEKRERI